jgi:alpha-L-fucosidase
VSGEVPSYLRGREAQYSAEPRATALEWFREARYGLFLHYGLYSLLGRHEWVQFREKIPVAEYAKLAERFTATNFDAGAIADLAVRAGMKYVNITTRHHDSFCLFDSAETDFKSTNAPAGRDLVAELAEACGRRGLGLCLYYSHGRDWRHPHAPNNDEWGGSARPDYDPPEPSYAYGGEHDLEKYVELVRRQVTELLTGYGPIAAVWLDGISTPLSGDCSRLRCQDLYDVIHGLQPQVLVGYKQGLLGTEDFFAPEFRLPAGDKTPGGRGRITEKPDAPVEICATMIREPTSWGHSEKGRHLSADEVWEELRAARRAGANLLLNTGPLPDGAIDERDRAALLAVGERLRAEGFPE